MENKKPIATTVQFINPLERKVGEWLTELSEAENRSLANKIKDILITEFKKTNKIEWNKSGKP